MRSSGLTPEAWIFRARYPADMSTASSSPSPLPRTDSSVPDSSFSPRRFVQGVGRVLALLGLAFGFSLVIDLLLLSTVMPKSFVLLDWTSRQQIRSTEASILVALVILAFALGALGFSATRLSFRTMRGWIYFAVIAFTVTTFALWLLALVPTAIDGLLSFNGMGSRLYRLQGGVLVFTACALGLILWLVRPRTIRRWLIICFSAVLVLIGVQFLAGMIAQVSTWRTNSSAGIFFLAFVLLGAVPLILVGVLRQLQRRSGWWISGGYLALAPVLIYLATDDAEIRRPMTVEEIAPAFPGAEQSFEILLRYGKDHPLAKTFREPKQGLYPQNTVQSRDPAQPEKWMNWLLADRKNIEAAWVELAPVRAWWDELNAFDRIGDLTRARIDAELPGFAPIRTFTMQACAIAGLQALDGYGDEAMATVLPVLEVSRKLQPSARTLVRQMISIVVERLSLRTIAFVLDHTTISAPVRSRLTAALAAGGGGAAGARRLVAIEYTISLQMMMEHPRPLGDTLFTYPFLNAPAALRRPLNLFGPFLYNPRATYNLYGEFNSDLQELIAQRKLAEATARTKRFFEEDARPHFKNYMGSQLIRMSVPEYTKVAESYWATQDLRDALLARVRQL